MKISQRWLKEFVDFRSSPTELSDALNMLGIEVESFVDTTTTFEKFVTARVNSKEKHPKADKLSVCQVDDGTQVRTVVCGAPNVDAGQIVVFAQPGAIVPNGGFEISARMLRGIESNGMICSRAELNLPDESHGIWVLDPTTAIGLPVGDVLGLADVIYDISITPNRADALSHLGIARIIAAYENIPLRRPQARVAESAHPIDVAVRIIDSESCPRYMARIVRNVHVAESPAWLKMRLELIGLRPRNVIVDISNYVLMECGHPLHAFDYDTVDGRQVVVECARGDERFLTLDDKERVLDERTLMICDPSKRLAIAGVMGGANSAITDNTTNVLIESAYFNPSSIRRSARRLGISSDASYRFERGTDIDGLRYAVDRAAQLMAELAGGQVDAGVIDVHPNNSTKQPIRLRYDRVRTVLGFEIGNIEIDNILERLECRLEDRTNDSVSVLAPRYRVDCNDEIDLIEEVAIMTHYDNIPLLGGSSGMSSHNTIPESFSEPESKILLRRYLAARGFHEVVTQNQTDPLSESLLGGDGVSLANPLGEELSIMRSSVIPSHLKVTGHNIRQGAKSVEIFEFAKTFHSVNDATHEIEGIHERSVLGIMMTGLAVEKSWLSAARTIDFFDLKGVIEALVQQPSMTLSFGASSSSIFSAEQCSIVINGVECGIMGMVSKKLAKRYDVETPVFAATLDATMILSKRDAMAKFHPISPYPVVERDLAFVISRNIDAAQVQTIIVQHAGAILQRAQLFDVFEHESLGQDRKSLAFRLLFSSSERTLTDEDVDVLIDAVVKSVTEQTGAELRS